MNPDNNQNGQQPAQQGRFMDSIQGPNPNPQPNNYGPTIQNSNQQAPGQNFAPQQPVTNGIPVGNQIDSQNNGSLKPKKSSKTKFIIVAVVGVLVLAIMTAIALVATPSKKQPSEQNTNNNTQNSQDAQKPANAIDVGNTNNSINQDMSGLNTDNDFPATQFDDKSLNL
jgi:hypothetical protein